MNLDPIPVYRVYRHSGKKSWKSKLYVSVYVCTCVRVYVCTCVRVYVCTCVRVYSSVNV